MHRLTRPSMAVCFAVCASASLPAAEPGAKPHEIVSVSAVAQTRGIVRETADIQPFTGIAYIPVGADLSSIKFEGVHAVKVATTRSSTTDRRYCQAGSREQGDSVYCPYVQDESPVPAYRVTYSYSGPPIGSDEYGSSQFTFSVDMRQEELNPALVQRISGHKISRAAAAEYFKLTASRASVQEMVIDEANSSLCEGNYSDGFWTHTNAGCEDKVAYKTADVPSDYIALKIDPVSSRLETVAADARGRL